MCTFKSQDSISKIQDLTIGKINSTLMDAQGIKRAIQDHFLCKLETMIATQFLLGCQEIG